MAVIDYIDVETAIGRPISEAAEQAQVTQWIDDVELILGSRLDLESLDDGVSEGLVAYVVREAVIARMRHRQDRNAEAGDGQSEDNFFLTVIEPWWALLDPGESGSGAFSARPYFEADSVGYSINAWEIA